MTIRPLLPDEWHRGMPKVAAKGPVQIVWFKRDLRVADHQPPVVPIGPPWRKAPRKIQVR